MKTTLDYDIFDLSLKRDPLSYQRRFQQDAPVHRSSQGFWVLTRHADVQAVLHDPRATTDRRDLFRDKLDAGCPYLTHIEHNLFYRSGEDHAQLRAPFARSFAGRALAAMRPRIEVLAASLVDRLDPSGFDLVADFAKPLPLTMIAELLGVPNRELGNLQRWSMALIAALEPGAPPETFTAADVAAAEMKALLADLLGSRRASPGDDVLSLVGTSGAPMTDDELLHNAIFLLSAGHDTTTALITGAIELLVGNPAQLAALRNDPALIATAVDELARLVSPAQMIGRVAAEAIEVDGSLIERGDPILLGIAAANRDPSVFDDPDALDVQRQSARPHLAFGFGAHVCLGAPLAREQARIAVPMLLDRFPELHAATEPERSPSSILVKYTSYRLHAA